MRAEVRSIRWERIWMLAEVSVTEAGEWPRQEEISEEDSAEVPVSFALVSADGCQYVPLRAGKFSSARGRSVSTPCAPLCEGKNDVSGDVKKPAGCGGLRAEEEPVQSIWLLRLNITNPGDERCLAAGRYLLAVRLGEEVCCAAAPAVLGSADRRFLFGKGREAYQVRFGRDGENHLVVRSGVTAADGTPSAGGDLSPRQRLMRRGLTALYHLRRSAGPHALPFRKKRILYLSEQNEELGTNLTALRQRISERGLHRKFRECESCRVTATDRHLGLRSWVRTICRLADADYLFLDDHAPVLDWLILDRDTVITQLWHGGIGFKASGYSRWGRTGSPAPYSCHRQYTYGISGSVKTRGVFAEIWGLNESRVLPAGLPRMDHFLDERYREERREKVRKKYPCCRGRKVILFAPTYRGKSRRDAHYPFDRIDFRALAETCGEDWSVLFRMHPWVSNPVPIPEGFEDRFADAGDAEDIEDLFCAADLLITDYSSDIYEYSLLGRPMLFYAFDEEEYAADRGFHLDYESSAPGRVCRTFPDLLEAVGREDFEEEKAAAYRERCFDHPDSHAADRVIDWVLLGQIPENIRREQDAENAFKRRIKR